MEVIRRKRFCKFSKKILWFCNYANALLTDRCLPFLVICLQSVYLFYGISNVVSRVRFLGCSTITSFIGHSLVDYHAD